MDCRIEDVKVPGFENYTVIKKSLFLENTVYRHKETWCLPYSLKWLNDNIFIYIERRNERAHVARYEQLINESALYYF